MSPAFGQGSGRLRHGEEAAVRNVIKRLREQFPELDCDTVARSVHGRYAELGDAPVRDFIPVLVERGAREQLKTSARDWRH